MYLEDKKNLYIGYKNRIGFYCDRNLFVNYRDKNQEWVSVLFWELYCMCKQISIDVSRLVLIVNV